MASIWTTIGQRIVERVPKDAIPLDPRDLGAVGDGTHDDTSALMKAFTSGRPVHLRGGNYITSEPLPLSSSLTVTGDGPGRTIFANLDPANQQVTNVSMSGMKITGSGSTVGRGIDFTQVSYSQMDSLDVLYFGEAALYAEHTSATYTHATGCTFRLSGNGVRAVNNANAMTLSGCRVMLNTGQGIYLDGKSTQSIQSFVMNGGTIESNSGSGIWMDARGTSLMGVHVEANATSQDGYGLDWPVLINGFMSMGAINDNQAVGCYFAVNGDDADHIKHARALNVGSTANAINLYAIGSSYQNARINSSRYAGQNGGYFFRRNNSGETLSGGIYQDASGVVVQTPGNLRTVNIKADGGIAGVALKINNKVTFSEDGTITYAGRSTSFAAAMPTTGSYTAGDYVRNTVPALTGTAGAQYVIKGWVRLTTGSTHTLNADWAQDRALTGS